MRYERLLDTNNHFVGFKRTIVEYLPAGADKWQLKSFDHDEELNVELSTPPIGIAAAKRATIRNRK